MAPVSQLKLYTNPRTRGSIVEWCAIFSPSLFHCMVFEA